MAGEQTQLSKREQEILTLVAAGLTNQEIARDLVISPNTVKVHLRNVFGKLEVASRTEAIVKAAQAGMIQVPGLDEEPDAVEVPLPPPEPALAPWQRVYFFGAALLVLAALLVPGLWQRISPRLPESDLSDAGLARLGVPPRSEAGRWDSLAPLPDGHSRLALAEVDGLLFAVGGETEGGVSDQVAVYDPRTNGWLRRNPKPSPAANIQAGVVGGMLFVPGGTSADGSSSNRLEVYDPLADSWATRASLPIPLAAYALAVDDGRVYLFGGWDGAGYLDTVLAYEVATDTWETRSPLPAALGFAAAASLDQRILVTGGYDGRTEWADCSIYYPIDDRYEVCAPLILPRGGLGLAVDGTSVYAIGGGWQRPVPFNERYDSLNDTWSSIPSPYQGQWRTLGVASIGSVIYAVGGWGGDYLDVNEEFQGRFRSFLPLGARGQ